jgi:hypothetical protein
MKINKKIISISIITLVVLGAIAYGIMMKPLNFVYSSPKYGDFNVTSYIPDNHSMVIQLESIKPIESWRLRCLDILKYNLSAEETLPRFIREDGTGNIIEPTSVLMKEDTPMVMTIAFKENEVTPIKYFETKSMVKKFLNVYTLEISPFFLQENSDGYDEMWQSCKAAVSAVYKQLKFGEY